MKTLIISPNAGMCNRFRAIVSAMVLGELLGRKVYHCWVPAEPRAIVPHVINMQRLSFNNFFTGLDKMPDDIKPDICFAEWLPGYYWYAQQNNFHLRSNAPVVHIDTCADMLIGSNIENIMIESSRVISLTKYQDQWEKLMNNAYKKLELVPEFIEKMPKIKFDIAIVIRRGDFLLYFPEARQSDTDIVNWLIEKIKGNIIILSDDKNFRNVVKDKLISFKKDNCQFLTEENFINETDEWKKDFMEFLLISSASVVYGTPSSSFSQQAAAYGEKTYIQLLS